MKRRNFVLNSSLAIGGLTMMPAGSVSDYLFQGKNFTSNRPPLEKRTFVCETVEKNLLDVKSSIADKEIAWMFENCYPNTLDTTDDATLFPYLIPSNIFAVLSLRQLSEIYSKVLKEPKFAAECATFADEVEGAIKKFGVANHLGFGEVYAYEADGFGNQVFMDDANVPSLISLAYLGAHRTSDMIYINTRRFVLSDSNPYYLKGKAAEGQASPHTGKEKIWPMGIILRAMTSESPEEITNCLKMLKNSHAGTGFMHEAFNKDNPADFSRKWFAWANTLFGELIIKVHNEHGEILAKVIS